MNIDLIDFIDNAVDNTHFDIYDVDTNETIREDLDQGETHDFFEEEDNDEYTLYSYEVANDRIVLNVGR